MHNPTSVSQEPSSVVLDFSSQFGRFVLDSSYLNLGSDSCSSVLSNFSSFNNGARCGGRKRSASLSLGVGGGGFRFRNILNDFNRFVRFHCEKIPIGFASLRVGNGNSDNGNGVREDGCAVLEDERLPLNGSEAENPKKVLILMSDTGGGHRASAEAIKAAFYEEFGDDYQVFVTDLWADHTPWPFNQLPRSYSFLVKHGPLWKMTYYGTAPRVVHQSNFAATSTFIARFHKLVTRCYCPTTDVAKRALKAGLQQSQIKIYGLPVRPSFVKRVRPKDELRRELGMDEDLPAVLLMGGGEGMGPIEATARALGDLLNDENLGAPIGQVLVICGRNKKLADKLNSINWKIPVQVKGFVTKMEECMGACDCIITKAGPGTIAEAMIRGLPIILNDYIAGQEAGNVPYVVENGCGKFSKSPKEIAKIVADWFGPRADELKGMSQNALRLARPDAVFKIVHDLHELVRQRSFLPEYSCTA
ncbi:probable monogalactosyldiacylglycerol synthase, chloroplastic isoform X3 [Gastrolobium bilobum]|uniref:probable monogalactosyldiacylglycerol synthase, chloroplastic isoform X3 n=1 Tax=Gastrolobium bilobum TaxID=150636 RepID=UPI002AB16832|nr:probable monogalactosyldiacylglycerol synthase, chloroplastic isoform X3 [Gastrolobium bilobum]